MSPNTKNLVEVTAEPPSGGTVHGRSRSPCLNQLTICDRNDED
jgi:hypothetical protein